MSTASAPHSLVRSTGLIALLLALCMASSIACGINKERREALEQSDASSIMSQGQERTYRLLVPDDLPERPALLVGLHGGGGDGKQLMNHTRLGEMAVTHGFVALFPDGIEDNWNDGRDIEGRTTPDSAFLRELIELIIAEHDIDPERVYITGISNGGFMTSRMVCDHADLFAGAAMVVAGLSPRVAEQCAYAKPMRLMFFKGTDDPLIPYEGGTVAYNRGEMMPTSEELAFWRARNRCEDELSQSNQFDADPEDGILVEHEVYAKGCETHPIEIYTAEGGGHTWPGNTMQYAPRFAIGTPYDDVDATEELITRFGLRR